jgi:DNA-directed RNA polymerase specialized sigma24 family protein
VIEMYYLREFSVREIADRLHASPSAVKMNLLRGRQELARMLGRARS